MKKGNIQIGKWHLKFGIIPVYWQKSKMKRTEKQKTVFPHRLTLWDIEHNEKTVAWFTTKGAELWYYLVGRGYVSLQWHNQPTDGYYFKLADIETAMQKLWDEGLIKQGGYFYEERYYL